MSRFVRQSLYRHVYCDPPKVEDTYQTLSLSTLTGDHNYIKGNSKFFSCAATGGGGPVYVLPYSQVGKIPSSTPLVNGHAGAVYDTDWNPFNDNILATSSDDSTVKLWYIPDGGLTERISTPLQTLSGHGKPVTLLHFHPTANNVIASAGKDPQIKVWDIEKGEAKLTLADFGALVQDFDWNFDGSLLASSSKDKLLKIYDPRTSTAVAEGSPHEGVKCFKLVWLGEKNDICTVGFNKQSKREFKVFDLRNLETPKHVTEIDQAAGVIMPFYDPDSKILFLGGKGDGNIRYYEIVDDAPYVFPLSEHRTSVPAKGLAFLPKRSCNPLKCEIVRMLKMTGSNTVEPMSFIVPRKSDSFQEDIFPDCIAGVPSLTADQYFAGENAPPRRVSMDPAKNGGRISAAAAFNPVASSAVSTPKAAGGAGAPPAAAAAPALFEGKTAEQLGLELKAAEAQLAASLYDGKTAQQLGEELAAVSAQLEATSVELASAQAAATYDGKTAQQLAEELYGAIARITELEAEVAALKDL